MLDRRGLGLLTMLLCVSCTAPSLGVRSASYAPARAHSLDIALDDPSPTGAPRLRYRLTNLFSDMLSWSPLHRHPKPNPVDETSLDCLTAAVYYEARSEPEGGQRAVAQVVLNRVGKPSFARSVCGVVHQRTASTGNCQFDFVCDGAQSRRREAGAWATATRIAQRALDGETYHPVGSATFYHSIAVSPGWSHRFVRVTAIGSHIFYRPHTS